MTEVHWHIIANLGFKFRPNLLHIAVAVHAGAREGIIARKSGGSSRAMLAIARPSNSDPTLPRIAAAVLLAGRSSCAMLASARSLVLNRMSCSCKIYTDKHIAQSLYNSRSSC